MTRLLCGVFACLVFCLVVPGLAISYLNLDRIDQARWESRLVSINRMMEKSDEIGKRADEMLRNWRDEEKAPSPQAVRKEQTELKRKALETLKLTNDLQDVLLQGAIYGSETKLKWAADLALLIAFLLSAAWLAAMFWATIKFGLDRRATRMVARTLLRDVGVKVKDIPPKDLLRVLQTLGVCKWHLLEVERLLRLKQLNTKGNSLIDLLQKTSKLLNSLFGRSDIVTVTPPVFDMYQLRREKTRFEERKAEEQRRIDATKKALDNEVVDRVRTELSRRKVEFEDRWQQLQTSQLALEEGQRTFENDRRQLQQDAKALQENRLTLEHERQLAARDRSHAAQQFQEVCSALDSIQQWGRRIDSGVLFLQAELAKIDPDGVHSARPDIIQGLAAALDLAASYRENEPAYAI